MYIIDKHKDYYDYLSHVYGLDKRIVFDRRGSEKISDEHIADLLRGSSYMSDVFIILEIGDVQYLIKVYNVRRKDVGLIYDKFISCKMKLMYVFHNHIHLYKTPISIREVTVRSKWFWKKDREYIISDNYNDSITKVFDKVIDLPILANTQITSLIDGEEIWKELQNYISSLDNDKDISIPMTDVEKAVTHGFDKKTSFRHPVK